jgi:hypothetical protein
MPAQRLPRNALSGPPDSSAGPFLPCKRRLRDELATGQLAARRNPGVDGNQGGVAGAGQIRRVPQRGQATQAAADARNDPPATVGEGKHGGRRSGEVSPGQQRMRAVQIVPDQRPRGDDEPDPDSRAGSARESRSRRLRERWAFA